MSKLRVGITGCIGSGKSLVAQILKEYGAVIVDMDEAGRWAVEHNEPVRLELRKTFGDVFFDEQGGLQRKKLASLVFTDHLLLRKLNLIVHPIMLNRVQELVKAAEIESPLAPYSVVDSALIFELHFEEKLDRIVTVSAPLKICIQRAQSRMGLSHAEVLKRFRSQLSDEEKKRRADYIIENIGSIESLRNKVGELHQWLLRQSPKE
jgi:dephospho-CoA kinase